MLNTSKQIPKARGVIVKNTPAEVAIPLPPLNFSQKVKLCPKIAPNPAIIINKEAVSSLIGTPVHSVAMIGANRQDKKPLKASAKRTTDAKQKALYRKVAIYVAFNGDALPTSAEYCSSSQSAQ